MNTGEEENRMVINIIEASENEEITEDSMVRDFIPEENYDIYNFDDFTQKQMELVPFIKKPIWVNEDVKKFK